MSNLSDVGFPVKSNEDVNGLVELWAKDVKEFPCEKGSYLVFYDASGVEIYLQMDLRGELLGFNPFFAGKTKHEISISQLIERDTSEMDGGYVASFVDDETLFVFDSPNIFANRFEYPKRCEIQLNAFASNDLLAFESEEEFYASQLTDTKIASKSFFPSGLHREGEDIPPQPHAIFAGEIKNFELKTNVTTGFNFYWLLVETLIGEIDVLADENLFKSEPKLGGIIRGSFWLTGKITRLGE
jgi:hypothetical protein